MDVNIGVWPTVMAARHPERIALVNGDTGERISYSQLASRVEAIAGALQARGVGKGSHVAVLSTNNPDMLAVIFAIARAGAVAVPVNFRLTASELAFILTDAQVSLLFASDDLIKLASEVADQVPLETVVFDGGMTPGARASTTGDLKAFVGGASGCARRSVRSDDVVMIMYTSGTTGRPKGAMLTHGNITWNAVNMIAAGNGLTKNDVTLSVAPLFHIGALGIFTLPLLYLGGTVVTVAKFDPQVAADIMVAERVSVQFLVPSMWSMLIATGTVDDLDFSAIRWVLSGGAPCPHHIIRHFSDRGWAFLEGFGLTETSPTCTVMEASALPGKVGSVGRPLRNVECRIVDDSGQQVATGVPGELTVSGPNVFVGYWDRPEATEKALIDGWFHTGDVAVCDDEGYITIVDRKKDVVITGGENVYPAEVEQALNEIPGVVDAAVFGLPDERWGERVAAVVVTDEVLTEGEVIAACRGMLAAFKCPRQVDIVGEVPRNASGKVLKRELRAHYSARPI